MECKNCGCVFTGKYSKYSDGKFCSRKCARGFSSKEKRQEINLKVSKKLTGRVNSKSGGPYSIHLKKECVVCGKVFTGLRKCCSNDCLKALRKEQFKKNAVYGYKEKAGTRYSGWYNKIYCNSTWELAYLLYCEEKGLNPVRCKEFFEYEFEGKMYKYYPDFILDGVYIEIKGLTTERDIAKWKQFPHKLLVHDKKEFLPVVEYIKKKYGKNFYELFYQKTDIINIPL